MTDDEKSEVMGELIAYLVARRKEDFVYRCSGNSFVMAHRVKDAGEETIEVYDCALINQVSVTTVVREGELH
jgi:hypothetical protein